MLKKIKEGSVINIQVDNSFYKILQTHMSKILSREKDPKEYLKNILEKESLTVDQVSTKLFLSLIKEIEEAAEEQNLTEEIKDSSQS